MHNWKNSSQWVDKSIFLYYILPGKGARPECQDQNANALEQTEIFFAG
jgi:hypothetical protein